MTAQSGEQTLRTTNGKSYIYALVDPRRPEEIRYVGRTETPRSRHIQHCCETGRSAKCAWIESLALHGVMPQMVILEAVDAAEASAKESLWIGRFRDTGKLTNTLDWKEIRLDGNLSATVAATSAENPVRDVQIDSALKSLDRSKKDLISETLRQCGGNKAKTARRLGCTRQTLYNWLRQFKEIGS